MLFADDRLDQFGFDHRNVARHLERRTEFLANFAGLRFAAAMCSSQCFAAFDRRSYSDVGTKADCRVDGVFCLDSPAAKIDHRTADPECIYLSYDPVDV